MSSPMSEKQKSLQPSTGKVVYIIGPMRLQNELIASCLEREIGAKCFVEKDINRISFSDDSKYSVRPRLVLLDCKGKNLRNLRAELRPWFKQKRSRYHIVFFNLCRDLGIEKKCVLEGIRGFFYERDPLDIFLKGVQAVFGGELWLSREIMTSCIFESKPRVSSSMSDGAILTSRQIEILAQVAVGGTNDEIAERLCISSHTVKTHLNNIYRRINVTNRLEAVLWAAKNL